MAATMEAYHYCSVPLQRLMLARTGRIPFRVAAYDVLAAVTIVAIAARAVQHSGADRGGRRFCLTMLDLGINATTNDEAFAARAFDNPSLSRHENKTRRNSTARNRANRTSRLECHLM
jgi:hypothetical protein